MCRPAPAQIGTLFDVLHLVYHPDERLNTAASPIERVTPAITQVALEMIDLMHTAQGIGLAGPQVGRLERIFVVHVSGDEPRVFINPVVVERSLEEEPYEEGCLSIPGVYAMVRRPSAVTVEALDESGNPIRVAAEGLLARVIQHEYDHLEGILFLEHLTRRRRERLLRAYRAPTE